MNRRTGGIAGFGALLIILGLAATASAYTGQVPGSITVSAQGSTCGTPTTVTATVLDESGSPIDNESVDWSLLNTKSSQDKVNTTRSTTNAEGVATTTVTLGCVSGSRTVRATTGDIAGGAVLDLSVNGLPNTSTVDSGASAQPVPWTVLPLLALAFVVGTGLSLRRLAATRR